MKLHSLTIHNIASITDTHIDFENDPLAGCEVFLITGPTGAGKSTLLDAMCLALFDTTPRLSARKNGVKETVREIPFADPRQLLRRNTGEGFVKLEFTGNDGLRYMALWAVQRARKKPGGKIQPSVRTLTRLSDSYAWCKKTEIEAIIAEATGLDFPRFCRTSMLAQGDFTRFLFSDDKEKAAVLEKLIRCDIYTRVGTAIFNAAKLHRDNFDKAMLKAEAVTALTPEECSALTAEIELIAARQSKLTILENELRYHREYLSRIKSLSKRVATQKPETENADALVSSAEIIAKRVLVERWGRSAEARSDLATIDRANSAITSALKQLADCKEEYQLLSTALARREEEYKALSEKLEALTIATNLSPDDKALIEGGMAIATMIDAADAENERFKTVELSIRDKETLINTRLVPAAAESRLKVERADDIIKGLVARCAQLQDTLKKLDPKELRDQCNKAVARKSDLLTLRGILTELSAADSAREKAEAQIAEAKRSLAGVKAELGELTSAEAVAGKFLEEARKAYELEINTLNRFAREMRRSLTPGCTCPVCRQKVLTPPPAEEVLNRLAEQARERRDRAQTDYDDTHRRLAGVRGRAAELERQTADTTMLDNLTKETGLLRERADAELARCRLSDGANIDRLIADADEQIARLSAKIKEAEIPERELAETETALTAERGKLSALEKHLAAATETLISQQSHCKTLRETLAADRERHATTLAAIAAKLSGDLLDIFGRGDFAGAARMIREKIESHRKLLDERAKLAETLPSLRTHLNACRIDACHLEVILSIPTDKASHKALKPPKTTHPEEQWRKLSEKIASALAAISSARQEIATRTAALDAFLAGNPDFTVERLREIDSHGSLFVEQAQREVRAADDARLRARSALAATLTELRTALNNPPAPFALPDEQEFSDELPTDPAARIEALTVITTELTKQLSARTGAIEADLNRSRSQAQLRAQLLAQAEQLRQTSDRWAALDEMFGSADGSKMRRIALSYVLDSLIRSANRFMTTLSDRYTLSVDPGSFVINVEDAWQGYSVRPASTVSGGESFLVALALALALSDIGDRQSVDILFIDEGFGTLSGEPLQSAIATLQRLHSSAGRRVGIISHVEELRSRIPVHIRVDRSAGDARSGSTVTVTTN